MNPTKVRTSLVFRIMVIISSQNLIKIMLPPRQELVTAIVSCSLGPRFSKCPSNEVTVVLKTNFISLFK
jgi:hypothetical protein